MTVQPIWRDVKRIASSDTNVFKYVFATDTAVAEAVLYRYNSFEDRTVICCSTQAGCPVGCRFCGAGDSFVRSLTADEIVAQVWHLIGDQNIDHGKIKRFQIMFMSMGEPMLNWSQMAKALPVLHEAFPQAALLVSTSAPEVSFKGLTELSQKIDRIGLQFSVHESTDEARDKLIPFRSKMSLEEIAYTGECWWSAVGRKPFFNYCAHEGNTSDEDVSRLEALFDPRIWECTISVICERDESIAAANDRQRELATNFAQKMLAKGYGVRTFDPAGQDDIGGGCGQLWYVQDWMQKHPELALPSRGRGLPKVHTPV